MAKSTTMTVRLKPEVSEKLEALARDMKRSKAYLASEAIEAYVDINAWQVAHIKEALDEDESGTPGCRMRRSWHGWNRGGRIRNSRRPSRRDPSGGWRSFGAASR